MPFACRLVVRFLRPVGFGLDDVADQHVLSRCEVEGDVFRRTDRDIEPTLKFLGHGIGQTIHEEPYITDTRTVVMEPNITFTMEPLYMIPGRMGFHVEDMYRITPTGFEAMTGAITPNDELIRIG